MRKIVEVAVGVLYGPQKKSVLISSRPQGKVCAGMWEFPGGKIESEETPAQALIRELAEELDVPGARLLATALVISHRTGSPLRDLLLRSARIAERQGEFERMLVVKTAQVRLSVRIVCLLPVAMVGLLTLMSPDFQQGLLTPSGVGCVCAAMMLDALALFLIRRMMAGVV